MVQYYLPAFDAQSDTVVLVIKTVDQFLLFSFLLFETASSIS